MGIAERSGAGLRLDGLRALVVLSLAAISLMVLNAPRVEAHRASDAYLSLAVSESTIEGEWKIALRDLDYAIGLDENQDGKITWGDLRRRETEIAAYAMARLTLWAGDSACAMRPAPLLVEPASDASLAVLRFSASCQTAERPLRLDYGLFFDLDPLHRGLVQIELDGTTQTTVMSPAQRRWQTSNGAARSWHTFVTYLREGLWHIWMGFDHILFLVSLLLPAGRRREAGAWIPVSGFAACSWDVAKIVTAFTLAHSVTLGLASLGWLALPTRWVEAVIAASIVLAALNNLFPLVTRRLWLAAFVFGLVHGVGFAGALQELGLPADALVAALLSFNLGVEAGQLAIVACLLPLIFAMRSAVFYRRVVVQFGSVVIALVATVWLVERSFGLTL